jgi:hypothetical protein
MPGPAVLDAGRPASRVSEKSAIGGAGKRQRRGLQPVGEEMELRRRAAKQVWAAVVGTGGRWVGRKGRDEEARVRETTVRDFGSSG